MAVRKKKAKKAKVAKKTKIAKGAKARVAKKAAKKTVARKAKKKTAVKAKAAKRPAAKKAAKAVAKKPARKTTKKKASRGGGEGNYKATKRFDRSEEKFIAKNRAKIPAMAKAAEAALDGPEGDELRAAEASTAAHAAGQPEE